MTIPPKTTVTIPTMVSNALLTMITGFIQACDTIQVDFHPVDTTIPLSATTSMSRWLDPETIVRAYQLNSIILRN
jgi:hypothetical protein